MESRSDSEILGDWDLTPPVDHEGIIMVSVPTSPESEDARSNPPKELEKEIETRVSDKERGSTSYVAGGDKEEATRRVMPSWEWGDGKWKDDGRKKTNEEKESEEIPIAFKEIIEALLRNSGEKVEEEKGKSQSCVEMLKSMGLNLNFP